MEKGNQWWVSASRLQWVFCTEVTVGLHTKDAAVEETHTVPPAKAWLGCWWASPTWRGECEPFLSICLSMIQWASVSQRTVENYYCEHSTTSMASTRAETTHGCAPSIGSTAAVITCLLQGAPALHVMRFYAVHMSAIASETTMEWRVLTAATAESCCAGTCTQQPKRFPHTQESHLGKVE